MVARRRVSAAAWFDFFLPGLVDVVYQLELASSASSVSAPHGGPDYMLDGVIGDARKRLEPDTVAGSEPMYRPRGEGTTLLEYCRACELLRQQWGPGAACGGHRLRPAL